MSELEPITREEMLLDGQDLEPITREEMFIKRIYDKTQSVPEPITRHEMFLKKAGDGGGEITVEELSVTANGDYSEQGKAYNPVHVNVEPKLEQRTVAISENGNYYYTPSEGKDGISRLHAVVNVPLPENGYLKKTATTSMSDAEQLPVASAKVTVTDKDVAKLYLTSDGVVSEDNTPYLYRQSPSGKSCVDLSIVGGTIAWNQLIQNGDFADATGWEVPAVGTLSVVNGVATVHRDASVAGQQITLSLTSGNKINVVNGHKYAIIATLQTENGQVNFVPTGTTSDGNSGYHTYTTKSTVCYVWDCQRSTTASMELRGYTGAGITSAIDFTVENYMCINLTQAFGTAIADYIYSLEQATAGSGIAWAKSNGYLTKKFYAYQSGKLESVNVASRKVVGKNLYDYDKAVYYGNNIYLGGMSATDGSFILPQGTYTISTSVNMTGIYVQDGNNNQIAVRYSSYTCTFTISTPTAVRILLYLDGASSKSQFGDIQLETGSTASEFEPYTSTTYPIDSGELRGILKIDNNGNLYYDGDELSADGVLKRKYGFRAYESGDESLADAITDGTNTVYKLTTPTTESATPYTNPQLVGSTEEFIDAGTSASTPTRDVDIPVGQDSKYIDGNIYIKYLNSVTTGEVELADENVIIPLEDTTYISSNGSASVEYWSKED